MSRIGRRLLGAWVAGMLAVSAAQAQTVIKPGFNIFTPDQDVEIGRQSAIQVEKQMPLVSDAAPPVTSRAWAPGSRRRRRVRDSRISSRW